MQGVGARIVESGQAVGAVFRNRDLRRLELAAAGSIIGNWAYFVALAVYAYGQGGAAAVGLVSVIRMIPAALLAPLTSTLADRFDRKHVMIGADLVRAALMLVAAATIASDGPAALVYIVVGLSTVTSTAFRPAQSAILPGLARSPKELTAANVALSTMEATATFIGPALGGLILVLTNVQIVFAVNAASFLWSAALLLALRTTDEATLVRRRSKAGDGRKLDQLTAGLRAIAGDRHLRLLAGLYTAQTLIAGALTVFVVVTALELLDVGEGAIGYFNGALGAGGLVGGFVALVLATRGRLASDFGLGIALYSLPLVLLGAAPSVATALVAFGMIGLGNSLVDINAITIMQRTVPDEVLGRALGVLNSLLLASIGIGALLAPVAIRLVGVRSALIGAGVLLPALVLLSIRHLRALDRLVAPTHVELLRGVPLLEPLPEAMLERLAASLVELRLPAGSVVIREGDSGDRFYVIAAGTVEIAGAPHGRGESFGEIALLRDVPRTATATATTDVVLQTLDRDTFVAAVTGHEPAHAAAEAVIAARLGSFVPERTRIAD